MTLHSPNESVRSSGSTRLMAWVLRSGFGRRLSASLVILRLRGRNSGALFELVVQYAMLPNGIAVVPGQAETKQWWRNLREPSAVEVLQRRTWHHARGIVLTAYAADYPAAVAAYHARWPRVRVERDQPIVVISWVDERDQPSLHPQT